MNSIKTLFRRVLFIYLAITGFVLLNAGMISYAQTGDDLADTNQNTQNVNRTYEFVSSDVYNVTADTGVTAPDTMSVIGQYDSSTSQISTIDYKNSFSGFVVNEGVTLNLSNLKIQNAVSNINASIVLNNGVLNISNVVFTSNHLENSDINFSGGAIHNKKIATLSDVNFDGNYVTSNATMDLSIINEAMISGKIIDLIVPDNIVGGGAIYNYSDENDVTSEIKNITGSFSNNYVLANPTSETGKTSIFAGGGAIYNRDKIDTIDAVFTANRTTSSSFALGGAILNLGTIENLSGKFSQNVSNGGIYAMGGALMNMGEISSILNTTFRENSAVGTASGSFAYGGAIYNTGIITSINATFDGNFASGTNAYAGAIYNRGTIGFISGNFINNYAAGSSSATAGAIWTNSSLTLLADNADYKFSGNYTFSRNTKVYQAIYVADKNAMVTISSVNGGSWTFDDSINGVQGYDLYITGDTNSYVKFNGTVQNANVLIGDINLYFAENTFADSNTSVKLLGSSYISMIDNGVKNYRFTSLDTHEASNALFEFDVDGNNGVADVLTLGATSLGEIKIQNLNFLNGSVKKGEYKLLSARNNNVYLVLTSSNYSYTNIKPVLKWNDEVDMYNYTVSLKSSDGTTNDTVVIDTVSDGARQDNLAALNQYKTTIDRRLEFDNASDVFNVSANTGESAYLSSLTIQGVEENGEYSKINYGGNYSGFVLNSGVELAINNVEFKNAASVENGSVLNITNSNVSVTYSGGKLSSNTSELNGGAIFITGNSFLNVSNVEFSSNTALAGGAVYSYSDGTNSAFITNLSGVFKNNTSRLNGGAISNYTDYRNGTNYSIISNIDTNFIGNRVIATSQNAYGGAIYNTGSILALNGDFYENSVSSDNNVFGGAIANAYIQKGSDINCGNISNLTSSFVGNSAISNSGIALGGAIYTANNLNFINNNSSKQLLIKDNYVIDSTGKNANAIFVDTVSGRKSLDFNLTNNSETIISDSIDGGRYDFINNNVQRGIVEIDGETVDTRYNISINGDKTSKITFNDVYAYSKLEDGGYNRTNEVISGIRNANVTVSDVEMVIGTKTFADENTSLTVNRGVLNLQDSKYSDFYINRLVSTSMVDYKLDFNIYLDENGELQVQNDKIYVGEKSSGTIRLVDIGLNSTEEFFKAIDYIYEHSENGYITVNVLNRANEYDSINLAIDFSIIGNPQIMTIADNYYNAQTNTYEVTNTSFIGEKGLRLNDTADSFRIGVLSRDDTLRAINTFENSTSTQTNRVFTFDNASEKYNVTANLGNTSIGTMTVNGNNSTIDLKGFSGFEITLANTVLNLNDVIITNSPVAVELNYLDTLSEIPNVMIRDTIFADNTVAISNNAGRIYLENSVISESANNQFNKINNSSDGYINVKDSKLYSSIVNNGSIIFDGTTILGKENYNVAISGNGVLSTTDSAIYTDLRYAYITDAMNNKYNDFTLNSGTLRIGSATFATSTLIANHGLIDLSGSTDGTLAVIDRPYTIEKFISNYDAGFVIDIDFSRNEADRIVINNPDSVGTVRIEKINGIETLTSSTDTKHIDILSSNSSNIKLDINLDTSRYIFYVDSYLQEDRDEYVLYDDSFVGEIHLSTDSTGISIAKNPVYNAIVELNQLGKYEDETDKTKIRTFILRTTTEKEPYTIPEKLGITCPGVLNVNGFYVKDENETTVSTISLNNFSGFEVTQSGKTIINIDKVHFIHGYSENNGSVMFISTSNKDSKFTLKDVVFEDNSSVGFGGAIYSKNDLTIIAEEINSIFSKNRQNYNKSLGSYSSNDIYLDSTKEITLNLIAHNGNNVQIQSGLEVANGTPLILNINDGSENSGNVILTLNKNLGSVISPIKSVILNGGTFDMHGIEEDAVNAQCSTIYTSDLVVNNDTVFNFDIDLARGISDSIYTSKVRTNKGNGQLLISKDTIKLIGGETDVDSVKVRLVNVHSATTNFLSFLNDEGEKTDSILLYTLVCNILDISLLVTI